MDDHIILVYLAPSTFSDGNTDLFASDKILHRRNSKQHPITSEEDQLLVFDDLQPAEGFKNQKACFLFSFYKF